MGTGFPLRFTADETAAAASREHGCFQLKALAFGYRLGDGMLVHRCAHSLEVAIAHVGKVAMEINPATVFQLIKTRDFCAVLFGTLAVDFQIARAAQCSGGGVGIQRNFLRPAGFEFP